jgi:hypothetical protein
MKNVHHFARAAAQFALISAAMLLPAGVQRMGALAAIPGYESRGKGGKRPRHPSSHFVAQDKRDARKARNRGRA